MGDALSTGKPHLFCLSRSGVASAQLLPLCRDTLGYPEYVGSDTLCPDPPTGLVVELQPMGDFSQKEAEQLEKEQEKHVFSVYGIGCGGIAPVMKTM